MFFGWEGMDLLPMIGDLFDVGTYLGFGWI
jgi:hypothetical protein